MGVKPLAKGETGMGEKKPKTVSLVLGSGGARGLAHIGIIEWLNEHDLEIASIAGASMGALVGGIYAAGRLDVYKTWVRALQKTDIIRFLDFAFSTSGLFKGDRIMTVLRDMVGEFDIEDLPISFTAVATDVERQREVWLSQGPLFEAIRASIAIPTIFTPYQYEGTKLVDGGLLNPVPIAPTFKDMTDLTVAVNLNSPHRRGDEALVRRPRPEPEPGDELKGGYRKKINRFLDGLQDVVKQRARSELDVFDLINKSFETMQNAIANVKLAAYAPDVIINIPRDACASFEFHRADEMFDLGHRMAESALSGYR